MQEVVGLRREKRQNNISFEFFEVEVSMKLKTCVCVFSHSLWLPVGAELKSKLSLVLFLSIVWEVFDFKGREKKFFQWLYFSFCK
jgi:hypothetical protein